jgi:hypothetical protein
MPVVEVEHEQELMALPMEQVRMAVVMEYVMLSVKTLLPILVPVVVEVHPAQPRLIMVVPVARAL